MKMRTYAAFDTDGRRLGIVRAENRMEAFNKARKTYGSAAKTVSRYEDPEWRS